MVLLQQSDMVYFETLQAMRRQELSAAYAKRDFLQAPPPQPVVVDEHGCSSSISIDIDVECRDKMCEWSHQIVDFCKFSRESVEISMSYLDRFLLTTAGVAALQDRTVYQLASMTCLYTAIKVHERQALNPKVVSQLSRGTYTPEQIESMEGTILAALQWRMNPPTALSFVREMIATMLSSSDLSEATKETLLTLASAQTERAVAKFDFLAIPASTIAYCAFLNALEATRVVSKDAMQYIGRILAQALHLDTTSKQVETVLHHLYPICQAAAIMHCLPQQLPQQATPSQSSQQSQPVIIINKACDDTFESPRGVSSA